MTSRVPVCFALALALAAVACGDDLEPTAGRFEDESIGEEGPPPSRDTKPAQAEDPNLPDDGPLPVLPGDPEPPAPPTDPGEQRSCEAARDLGVISGDTGAAQVVAQGNCDDWVKVRVTENYTTPLAAPLKVTATLVSPNPDDFDLYAYVNVAADALECTSVTQKSELPATRSDVVKLSWGETYTTNASDDARTVSFQVKKKTPGCSVGQWSLVVQGNY